MAGNRLVWDGLDELKAELRRLPDHLKAEGAAIVWSHANAARSEIIAGYPDKSGHLRAGVRVTLEAGSRFGAGAVLKSAARHAWLYEHGTKGKKRVYSGTDKKGRKYRNADRGPMPAAPTAALAIPKIIRWRTRMYAQLAALLERAGLRVSGSFGS
jgi:hypothetical protein